MNPNDQIAYPYGVYPNGVYLYGVHPNGAFQTPISNSSSGDHGSDRSGSHPSRRSSEDVYITPHIIKRPSNNKKGYQLLLVREGKRSHSFSFANNEHTPPSTPSSSSTSSTTPHRKSSKKPSHSSSKKYHAAPMPPPAAPPAPASKYSTWDAMPKYSTWDAAPKYTAASTGMTSPPYTPQSTSSASASPPAATPSCLPPSARAIQPQMLPDEQEIDYLTGKVDFLQRRLQQAKRAQEVADHEGSMQARVAAKMLTERVRGEWLAACEELEQLLGGQ